MKKYLDQSVIKINTNRYITLIIVLAPILNFLSGITIDIYAPSMPAIANYFNASITATKNTISITLLGWTFGALCFGILIDSLGRKQILVYCMLAYIVISLLAPLSTTIHQLMLVRFIQGLTIAAITIGCRALVIDNISGPRYAIAILYTSVGYGLGPIIGPFIGGLLQHYFGWQANFIALTLIACCLIIPLILFVHESIPERHSLHIKHVGERILTILKHKKYVVGISICGIMQIEIMLYPALGPFIVEGILHKSVLVFGNTALLIGACYLTGSLVSRLLLKYIKPKNVAYIACIVLLIGTGFSHIVTLFNLNLTTLLIPIGIICLSAGILFPILLATNLRQFPKYAGLAMAIQASSLLLIGAIGIYIVSHIHITTLLPLAAIYTVLTIIQLSLFFGYYKKIFEET